jgi:hypothetical protein
VFRFKENCIYLKQNLLANYKCLVLNLNLMQPTGFDGNSNKILKFEEGYLIDQDVVQSIKKRQRSSIARCPRKALSDDVQPGKQAVDLEISCPKCKVEDCSWLCHRCLRQLRYDPESVKFCCDCGAAPVQEFEFKCKDYRFHGPDYVKFAADRLKVLLDKLSTFKQKTILVSCLNYHLNLS